VAKEVDDLVIELGRKTYKRHRVLCWKMIVAVKEAVELEVGVGVKSEAMSKREGREQARRGEGTRVKCSCCPIDYTTQSSDDNTNRT
jgi:hypothetical protein